MSYEWNTKERFDKIDHDIAALNQMLRDIKAQNVLILAAVQKRSKEDQNKLNNIYAIVTGDIAKIKAALPPNP